MNRFGLLKGAAVWNDYLWPLIMTKSDDMKTVADYMNKARYETKAIVYENFMDISRNKGYNGHTSLYRTYEWRKENRKIL